MKECITPDSALFGNRIVNFPFRPLRHAEKDEISVLSDGVFSGGEIGEACAGDGFGGGLRFFYDE